MAETIIHTWQTVEQAAVTLNVSTRTIARRLANGSLESRVDENGRRLVLVQQIAPAADGQPGSPIGVDGPSDTSDTVDEYVNLHLSAVAPLPPVSLGSAEARQPQTLAVLNVLETTLVAAREDASQARRSAKWALAGVAAMGLLIVAAAALVSSTVTKSVVTTDLLRQQLAETKADLKQTQSELIATHTAEAQASRALTEASRDLTEARRAADQARQQPPAVTPAAAPTTVPAAPPAATPVATKPTTQPTLFGRVVQMLAD